MSRTAPLQLAMILLLPACGRGCGSDAPRPLTSPVPSAADVVQRATHPAEALERALGIRLAERRSGRTLLPGWAMLPWRRLTEQRPDQDLYIALAPDGIRVLERKLESSPALEDARLAEVLRWSMGQWQSRAGVAANRLVIAADTDASEEAMAQVRRVALSVGQWRVVAVARDQEYLVELMLNPPPARRPDPSLPAPATRGDAP